MIQQKDYFIIYKTTCKVDNRFYIGSHKIINDNLEDGYLGSGVKLRKAIEDHGVENFYREILDESRDQKSALILESSYIKKHFYDPLCLNLNPTGNGGDKGLYRLKPIIQIDNKGNFIKKYSSRFEAVDIVPGACKAHNVSNYLTGKNNAGRLHSAGFLWVYEEDVDKIIPERFNECLQKVNNLDNVKNDIKFLLLMDIHIKDNNVDLVNNIFDQIIDICLEQNIQFIFQGGDIFNSRASQSLNVLMCFVDFVNKLRDLGIGFYCISGNHDKVDLESCKGYPDIIQDTLKYACFSKETSITFLSSIYDFHFLPYFKENGSYKERLQNIVNELNKDKKNILITHIAISGVKNNDGGLVENNLTSDLFDAFDNVLVAHYHNESKINEKIHYIGSVFPQNFGEDNNKGAWIISKKGYNRVNLNFPKYFTYRFDCKDIIQITDQLKQVNHQYDKIRFVITGNETEIENFNRSIFDNYNVDVKFEKIYSQKIVELKKYKEDDIMLSFKQFCLDKQVQDNIRVKSINYLEKVL